MDIIGLELKGQQAQSRNISVLEDSRENSVDICAKEAPLLRGIVQGGMLI